MNERLKQALVLRRNTYAKSSTHTKLPQKVYDTFNTDTMSI